MAVALKSLADSLKYLPLIRRRVEWPLRVNPVGCGDENRRPYYPANQCLQSTYLRPFSWADANGRKGRSAGRQPIDLNGRYLMS
jgi:hypothetical protein